MTGHVEGHAAAIMRRDGVREATLYINMRPCLGARGCAENLRAVLPAGTRLVVHQVFADGSTKVFNYPGTGDGLEGAP
ncbi:hypothetical protein IW245_005359 [Longispora fulva]|uniref:Uncharacterized protein n=2 Tax=Longispora fulva TaxID=619741 RepID=A0A8J7GK88_9ACTN|nr:hypothetical protein [Longispora fulva]